jgi:hypothetical protein
LPKTAVFQVRISRDFRAIFVPFGMLGKPYILAYENTSLSARISREIGVKMEVARFREIENSGSPHGYFARAKF